MFGTESPSHNAAKFEAHGLLLKNRGSIVASTEREGGYRSWLIRIGFAVPVVECTFPQIHAGWNGDRYFAEYGCYPEMIFDVGLVWDGKVIGCVEIMKSHWLDDRKKMKLRRAGIFCVGITAYTQDWNHGVCRFDARELILPRACAHRVELMDVLSRMAE
jgi:hypothetical protein